MLAKEVRLALAWVVTGQRMVDKFIREQRRPWTPNLPEFLLAIAQYLHGVAFSPWGPYFETTDVFYKSIQGDSTLATFYGVWGLLGLFAVIGHALSWLGLLYPITSLRVTALAVAFGFWLALAMLLVASGSGTSAYLYIVAAVLTASHVRTAVRNGRVAKKALAKLER